MAPAEKPHALDLGAECTLLGLLAYLPFAYGGVLPMSHLVTVLAAAAMALCLAIRMLLVPSQGFAWSWIYLPIGLYVGLVALQLAPLPIELLEAIAPQTATLWKESLADVPGASADAATISLYPHATATDLRLLLAAATIFVVVANLYRTRAQQMRLLGGISILGMAIVVTTMIQHLTDSFSILHLWELPEKPAHSGPFVHNGHFAQFLNLSIGAALALFLLRIVHREGDGPFRLEHLHRGLTQPHRRFDLALITFLVLAMVVIALSRSRNGLLAMTIGATVVAGVLHWTRFLSGFGWSLGGLITLAFVVLLVLGFDPVYERMATIGDLDATDARVAILRDTFSAWASFPGLGMGHGAFELVFPMFDESTRRGTAQHAENLYAEILAETGAVGFGLFGAALTPILIRTWQAVRGPGGASRAITAGMIFGLVAVLFHALTDFGLRMPAVGILALTCFGLIAALRPPPTGRPLGRLAGAAMLLGAAALLLFLSPAALRAVRAEARWQAVQAANARLAPAFEAPPETLENLHRNSNAARELEPGNITYHYWHAMHGWFHGIAERTLRIEAGDEAAADAAPLAREVQAVLLQGIAVAPTHGPTWSSAGDLGVGWLDDATAGRWIHRGMRLAPHHPHLCLVAGRQLIMEGKDQAAAAAFRRAVHMGAPWKQLQALLIDQLRRPKIAREVARGDARLLIWLSQRLEKSVPQDPHLLDDIRTETRELMLGMSKDPQAPAWVFSGLAKEHLRSGDPEAAVEFFRQYLLRVPRSYDRLELIETLVTLQRNEEARREAQRFETLHPESRRARKLLPQRR